MDINTVFFDISVQFDTLFYVSQTFARHLNHQKPLDAQRVGIRIFIELFNVSTYTVAYQRAEKNQDIHFGSWP